MKRCIESTDWESNHPPCHPIHRPNHALHLHPIPNITGNVAGQRQASSTSTGRRPKHRIASHTHAQFRRPSRRACRIYCALVTSFETQGPSRAASPSPFHPPLGQGGQRRLVWSQNAAFHRHREVVLRYCLNPLPHLFVEPRHKTHRQVVERHRGWILRNKCKGRPTKAMLT